MTISAVLFDLDDTLHNRSTSIKGFALHQYQKLLIDQVDENAFIDRFMKLDAHGYFSKAQLYPQILAEFHVTAVSPDILLNDYAEHFHIHARLMEGARELLKTLRSQGFKLGIISNGWTDFQYRTIDALGLREAVDTILISQAENIRKPDKRIFHRAAQRLNTSPDQCIFVGDNPTSDILGAQVASMRPIWLRNGLEWPSDSEPPSTCVTKLLDIFDYLPMAAPPSATSL